MGRKFILNTINLVTDIIMGTGNRGSKVGSAIDMAAISKFGNNQNHQYARSIRGRADKFVMQFPMVVSDSVSVDTAETVRNQIELERAVNIKLVLDNTPVFDYDPNGGFLHQIHTNVNIAESVEGEEEKSYSAPKSELDKMNKDELVEVKDLINESALNDYTLPRAFLESDMMNKIKSNRSTLLNEGVLVLGEARNDRIAKLAGRDRNSKPSSREEAEELSQESRPADRYNAKGEKIPSMQSTGGSTTIDLQTAKTLNNSIPIFINTTINFAIRPYKADGTLDMDNVSYREKEVSFGVKAVQHVAQSQDIAFFLTDASKRSNFFAKLINFTSGEMNLVKRLFGIDKYKHAAEAYKRTKNSTWKNLLRLGDTENFRRYANRFGKNIRDGIIPTTTLVISSAEEEQIFKKTGYKISEHVGFASTLYKDLYLQELMIVDEVNQIITRYSDEAGFDKIRINSLSGGRLSDSVKRAGDADNLEKLLRKNL